MLCVLRVSGPELDLDRILKAAKLKPFRVERAGVGAARENSLHYDVTSAEAETGPELVSNILEFLERNAKDILLMREDPCVANFTLDIAVVVSPGAASLTFELSRRVMELAFELGLSITVSNYR